MKGRAYAQISWSGRKLGLRVVNPDRQTFFIYAKYALRMLGLPGEYILIKKQDRNPAKAIYYHGGEVIGCLQPAAADDAAHSLLTLYFGPLEKRIQYQDETGELLDVIDEQEFRFPPQELTQMLECLAFMVKQKDRFEQLLFEARDMPGSEIQFAPESKKNPAST